MKVSKWGDSLAVRLPEAMVEALGLKQGDDVSVVPVTANGESGAAQKKYLTDEE